jgi:hypothetical protein
MAYEEGYETGYDDVATPSFTFTPPTFSRRILPDFDEVRSGGRAGLWRHFGSPINVGYHVIITSGTATTYPGRTAVPTNEITGADTGSGENGIAWFRGGISYTVTQNEKTALESAGYTF